MPSKADLAYCSFSAYALPQLRALGWNIEVDASYPYQVVETDAPWYAAIEPDNLRLPWYPLRGGSRAGADPTP